MGNRGRWCKITRNAIGLLKLISQGEEDIRQGRSREQKEVFKDLEALLAETGR